MTYKTEVNADMLPTKELLRHERKQQYQRLKALRHKQRQEEKAKKKAEKLQQRQERDQELWQSLQPAAKLAKKTVDKAD